MKSVQEGPHGIIIRIADDIYRALSTRRGPGQSFNDVLRRQLGLSRKGKWIRRRRQE